MEGYILRDGKEQLTLSTAAADKLLQSGQGDAALLYLALCRFGRGVTPEELERALPISRLRIDAAERVLQQLGILPRPVEDAPPAPAEEDSPAQIAIPGYEGLTLQAGAKKQSIRLPNPEENHCYFQISLYLADDTLLWQSDLIKPGKTSAPITLSRPLDPGAYPGATLRYACFRLDREKTPLNGAETKLTLWVQ